MAEMAGIATRSIHADSHLPNGAPVGPSISVSTTFRYPSPNEVAAAGGPKEFDAADANHDPVYSRYSQPTMSRSEAILSSVIGNPTLLYPSGISAILAVLLLERPDVIAKTSIYHGALETIKIYQNIRGPGEVKVITLEDDFPPSSSGGKLLVWLETPVNPTGESRSIQHFADKAHSSCGKLFVDSTFGPPPLQDAFKWGADIVMHSATKYFTGHSDALLGTISVKTPELWQQLWHNRTFTGSVPGSLESWLVLRSVKTLSLRVRRQSETATKLAKWLVTLVGQGIVEDVCFNPEENELVGPGKQMESGPACFALMLSRPEYATELGHSLEYFVPATSLGGVESLIERRLDSDPHADPRLMRLSIGLEDVEDLQRDLERAFETVRKLAAGEA